jgi:phage shock protein A
MADAGAAIERARAKTQEMQARAGAMDELIASGTLEDFTSDKTQLDRELQQMASQSQVEQELAKMKQEIGPGGGAQKELAGGGSEEKQPS